MLNLGDAADLKYQLLLNCDLQIIGDEFSRKPYAMAVQQGSPLKDIVNDGLVGPSVTRFGKFWPIWVKFQKSLAILMVY